MTSPSEFVRAAKGIVKEHSELKRRSRVLRQEIRRLENEQEKLAREKEKQLVAQLLIGSSCPEVDEKEIRRLVQREITACLHPEVR